MRLNCSPIAILSLSAWKILKIKDRKFACNLRVVEDPVVVLAELLLRTSGKVAMSRKRTGKRGNEYKDGRKVGRVWWREFEDGLRPRLVYGVDLEWPWRGTAFDGAELLVTCSLPARRCGRPPSLLPRPLSREPSDSSPNVSAISVSAGLASPPFTHLPSS